MGNGGQERSDPGLGHGGQERSDPGIGHGGQERYGGASVAADVPLDAFTTLRVGPVARKLITCSTTEQVIAALTALDRDRTEPVLILAGGSNLVIDDGLTDLTVVRLATSGVTIDGDRLRVDAGAVWDDVVALSVGANMGGLECLSGIPGSAGATPVQNVGAYGVEVADLITRVRLLDRRSGEDRWVEPEVLEFGYRHSVLKNSQEAVVLEVEFALDGAGRSAPLRYGELVTALGAEEGQRVDLGRAREAVLALRRRKGMVLDPADHDTWSAGSFFTNPVISTEAFDALRSRSEVQMPHYPAPGGVKLAAGWLVEQAGFGKGFPGPEAPARLSTKHALAVTNRGSATTADVLQLARTVRDGVRSTFGINLHPEPTFVGATI